MSETTQAASGAAPSTSGDGNVQGANNSTSGEVEALRAQVEKLLREKKNVVAKAQELESSLKSKVESDLLEQQKYKELAEKRGELYESVSKELDQYKTMIQDGQVNTALSRELAKLGMNQTNLDVALKLIDRRVVEVDPSTNTVIGADVCAKTFYDEYSRKIPGLFGKPGVGVNQQAPMPSLDTSDKVDLSKLSYKEKSEILAKAFIKR